MSKRVQKTKSTAKKERTPITLTRSEVERTGMQLVAVGEALARAIRANMTALTILADARDRAEGAGRK